MQGFGEEFFHHKSLAWRIEDSMGDRASRSLVICHHLQDLVKGATPGLSSLSVYIRHCPLCGQSVSTQSSPGMRLVMAYPNAATIHRDTGVTLFYHDCMCQHENLPCVPLWMNLASTYVPTGAIFLNTGEWNSHQLGENIPLQNISFRDLLHATSRSSTFA